MSAVRYTGQKVEAGMIVCRRSVMLNGFASRPVTIVKVTGSRAMVRDRDGDERRIDLSTIEFIVSTMEEGFALAKASIDFMEAEQRIEREHLQARAARKRDAIRVALARVQGGAQ